MKADGTPLRIRALLWVILLLACAPGPARAMDFFGGFFGGFNYVPSPTEFLNQRSLNARGYTRESVSHNPYANNPNSYFNRVRDNGFVPRMDVSRRTAPVYQSAAAASPAPPRPTQNQPAAPPVSAAPLPKPIVPISSFFDPSQRLIWPNDAPVHGDLKEKRAISDQASLAVLVETQRQGLASLTNVTNARQSLLDYGRPALQSLRETATPRIADTFHLFLLSLYESLAQAAQTSDTGTGSAPPPP
jgi:hypothetical protein